MGNLVLAGSSSGSTTITPSATGTYTITLPAETGTIQTSGAGFTTNGVAYASSTSALTTGSALTFNGSQLSVNGSFLTQSATIIPTSGAATLNLNDPDNRTLQIKSPDPLGNQAKIQTTTNHEIVFGINSTEQMRLTTTGRLGIGTSSPSTKLTVYDATTPQLTFNNGTSTFIVGNNSSGNNHILYGTGAYPMIFYTNATEAMRIDSSGNVGIGTSSNNFKLDVVASANCIWAQCSTATGTCYQGTYSNTTGLVYFANWQYNVSSVGTITSSGSGTAYNTTSDYRLNTIAPMTGALAKVALLKPITYKWNVDGSDSQGFIAHELQAVVPECVTGEKDGVDEDGNPKYQGVDTSFLVATLTSAIQELSTLITAQQSTIQSLTERITALEGART